MRRDLGAVGEVVAVRVAYDRLAARLLLAERAQAVSVEVFERIGLTVTVAVSVPADARATPR